LKQEIKDLIPPIIGLGNDWSLFEYEVEKRFGGFNKYEYSMSVSIVIPVYNRKEKLAKTIAGLTQQTYPLELIEVIIADDGSSDNPDELIDLFSKYFDIKYIRQDDEGYRLSEIRNKGIESAKHEQIIILDCDMLPLPTLVESYMMYAHVTDKAVLIGGRRYVNTDNTKYENIIKNVGILYDLPSVRTDTGKPPENGLPPSEDWRYKIYRETNNLKNSKYPFRAFCGGNVCFPKSLIDKIGGFDEDFKAWGAEDTEFGYRVYNQGYWLIPVEKAEALHQEPPNGSNETDRESGKIITQPILIEKCPAFYRKMEVGRIYEIPKVSVYIPAYNAIDFIEEAIESALNQTYTDLEVVVVNDGSTDETGEFLDKLYGVNPRVTVIHQENGGISSASNTAINNCRGEYILQLDSDDAILSETVEMLVNVLDKNDIGFVYADSYLTDQTGKVYGMAYSWSMYDRNKLLQGMMIHHPRMFRKRDFNRTNGFDENLTNAVDYDFFLKLSEVTDGYHLQTPLYLYRQHNTNTSKVNSVQQDKNNFRCIELAIERLGLTDLVSIKPDPSHNRKTIKSIKKHPKNFKLDFSYIANRMGLKLSEKYHFDRWNVDNLVCPESFTRQESRMISNQRIIRVGSYGSVKVAQSVSSIIEKEYNVSSEIFSTLTKSGTSYFVDVQASSNDRESVELMRTILNKHKWKAEVISNPAQRDIIAVNKDTSLSVDDYQKHNHSGRGQKHPSKIDSAYIVKNYWKQNNSKLIFTWRKQKIFFEMPEDWKLEDTHEDLFRLAHYVLVAPWDNSVLDHWSPTRKPGFRPGLAFSGGIDSAAALALMPSSTILIYNERSGIKGKLDHTNAIRFFEELKKSENKEVVRIKSNHESIRMSDGKIPGFSTDYACAVQVILLADYFGLDSLGTGMPLENTYLWHGHRYRDFSETWFWTHNSKLFSDVGLSLYQPVAGCSEVVNMMIVKQKGWLGWAQSCLRSNIPGEVCGRCWKCFRKNSLLGTSFIFEGEIKKFLSKRPLKQAASTLYSMQKDSVSKEGINVRLLFDDLKPLLEQDLSFLEKNYQPALDLLPQRYRAFTRGILSKFSQPMSNHDIELLKNINFFPEDAN